MTLLTIVQDAAVDLGLAKPSSVVSATSNKTAQALWRYANAIGKHLAKVHDWQNLIVQKTFTTVATSAQGARPTDFDRFIYNVEMWNRSSNQKLYGPTPQRFWQQLESGVAGGVAGYWRVIGNQINIWPAPTAGQTIAYEYISTNWALDSDATTTKAAFDDDADTVQMGNEELITLGVIWKYAASKGFARYAEDLSTFEREKEKIMATDRGTSRIRPMNISANYPLSPVFSGTDIGS